MSGSDLTVFCCFVVDLFLLKDGEIGDSNSKYVHDIGSRVIWVYFVWEVHETVIILAREVRFVINVRFVAGF